MKRSIFSILMLFITLTAFAQKNTKERDVMGVWKLHINVDEAVEEESKDMGFFEGVIAKSVTGMVQDVMDKMDITFDFQKNNVLFVTVVSDFENDETEVEELKWELNEQGHITIDDIDNDNVQIQNDGYWVLDGDKLLSYKDDGSFEKNAWMERVK